MAGRILVLDDEENYAEMLQDLLRENNYRVDMATRPERAIAQLEEIPYDLVISDYKMPVMDGADFLKKARELYPNLPFILVSGLMNTPELVKVANMSVTLVMEKPLDTQAFLGHVARFSEPLTDEEKEQLAKEGESAADAAALSYPDEPRFFSASNFMANRFLQSAWALAKEGRELFILEPSGGDAELALKDLSHWRGNGDMPVDVLGPSGSNDALVAQVRGVLADSEKSRLLGLRLASVDAVSQARKLTEQVQREVEDSDALFLVYIVTSDSAVKQFDAAAGGSGVVLPRLCLRPSDLAVYARRVARIAAERAGRSQCAAFTPEAAYALLAHDWPRNYRQVQETVQAAVAASAGGPITLDAFGEALGERIEAPAADSRIAALMKAEQGRYLKSQLESQDLSAADLAKKLELDSSIQTEDDLRHMPLLRSELGRI